MTSIRGKLLPSFAITVLGAAALLWGTSTPPASANVTSTDASVASFASAGNGTSITVGAQDDDGDLTIIVTEIDPSTEVTLSAIVCTPNCPGGSTTFADATKTIKVVTGAFDDNTTPNAITVTFALNATCENDDTMRVTAKQGNGEGDVDTVIFVQCDAPDPNLVVVNDALAAGAADEFEYELSANATQDCVEDAVMLVDGEERGFFCEPDTTIYTVVLVASPTGFHLTGITCDRQNVPSGDVVVSLNNSRVRITLRDGDDRVSCTFTSELAGTPTPTVTATPGATKTPTPTGTPAAPSTLDLTASSTLLPCNGSSTVSALVRDQSGQTVANGTLVNFVASSGGGLSTGTIGTVNGVATVVFNATTTSTATITATAGGVSKNLTLQVNCGGGPVLSAPPAAPLNGPVIKPPNTGDAGLIGSTDWSAYGMLVLIAVGTLSGVCASLIRKS